MQLAVKGLQEQFALELAELRKKVGHTTPNLPVRNLMCVFCACELDFSFTLNVFSWRNLRRKSPSWKSAIAPSLVVWKTVKLWQMARRGQETIHVKYAPVV